MSVDGQSQTVSPHSATTAIEFNTRREWAGTSKRMEGGAEQRGDPNSSSLSSGSAHAQREFVFVWFSSVRSRLGRSASGSAGNNNTTVVCSIVVWPVRHSSGYRLVFEWRFLVMCFRGIGCLVIITYCDVNCAFVNAGLWNKIKGMCYVVVVVCTIIRITTLILRLYLESRKVCHGDCRGSVMLLKTTVVVVYSCLQPYISPG